MIKTVKIPQPNVELFEKKMEKLVKLSEKLNSGNVSYNLLSRKMEEYQKDNFIMFHEYEIAGDTPTLNGYKMVAYLEHLGGKNLVNHIDKSVELPDGLQERENYCEHCHNNRRRVHLFILEEESTGNQIQVGRTCVKDFTGGHDNPERIAEWYQYLSDIEAFQSLDNFSGMIDYSYSVLKVVAHSAYLTDKRGYVKSADHTEDNPSTSRLTKESFNELNKETLEEKGYYEKAQQVIDWVLGQTITEYGYMRDLQTLIQMNVIPSNKVGIVASAYHVYNKAMEKEQAKRATDKMAGKPVSQFIGEIGERKTHELTFDREVTFETEFGYMGIQFFHDADWNVYIWKTSKYLNFEEGQEVNLTGTLKSHSEYNGVNQNVLTRCKVVD